MSMRFGFAKKAELTNYWNQAYPALTRTALRVYVLLLEHCNPVTGRCDPSIARLMSLLQVSRKSVQKAIKELRKRKAIKTRPSPYSGSRQFDFLNPPEEPDIVEQGADSRSETGELEVPQEGNYASPKKEKEKNKKREEAEKENADSDRLAFDVPVRKTPKHEPGTAKHQKLFEEEVQRRLKQRRIDEMAYLCINGCIPEDAYRSFCQGQISRNAAIEKICEACRAYLEGRS